MLTWSIFLDFFQNIIIDDKSQDGALWSILCSTFLPKSLYIYNDIKKVIQYFWIDMKLNIPGSLSKLVKKFLKTLFFLFILSCSFALCFTFKILLIYTHYIHKRVCIPYLNIRQILSVKHSGSVCTIWQHIKTKNESTVNSD